MGTQNAYACDGPDCNELVTKRPNTESPDAWMRVTVKPPEGGKLDKGSFCSVQCSVLWLADLVSLEIGSLREIPPPDPDGPVD